jgi:hypothetical protein
MIITTLNPLVAPEQQKFFVHENHQKAIRLLRETAYRSEILDGIRISKDKARITEIDTQIKMMSDSLDTATQTQLVAERNLLRDQLKARTVSYLRYNGILQKIAELADLPVNKRDTQLKSIAETLHVDVQGYVDEATMKIDDIEERQSALSISYKSQPDCSIISDEKVDEIRTIILKGELLCQYTPQKVKSYFKTRDLLTANAAIIKVNKTHYIRAWITIASKDAAKNYGTIAAASFMKITLVTGKTVHVYTPRESVGVLENYTGYIQYIVDYKLTGEDIEVLRSVPLDTIGIMWSSGFELYPVYEVDRFIHDFDCLQQIK